MMSITNMSSDMTFEIGKKFQTNHGITSPKAIIKMPSFEIGKYKLQHVIKIPYILPYYYWVKTKVHEKVGDLEFDSTIGKSTYWGINGQMPGYTLEVSDKV